MEQSFLVEEGKQRTELRERERDADGHFSAK